MTGARATTRRDALASGGGTLLEVSELRTEIKTPKGRICAVDGVSFRLDIGQTLGIVGESGCGKSMTALSLINLLPGRGSRIASGHVWFNGVDLVRMSERRLQHIRGDAIGMIFQDPMTSLNPTMRIGRQIAEPLRRHRGMDGASAARRVRELLDEVHIARADSVMSAYPHELSGGMRQRIMIAIAIACEPQLLIADEPTTALDVTTQAEILQMLRELQTAHHMGMILITHDMGVVANVAHTVAVMYAGQLVEFSPVGEMFDSPEHPYTEALLAARPQLDLPTARTARLHSISGNPPNLMHPIDGCRFAARCAYVEQGGGCGQRTQPLYEIRAGHWVRSEQPSTRRAARQAPALDREKPR